MNKIIFIFTASLLLTSCEIITIGNPNATHKEVINFNQESPLGALYLFITELDSNNVPAAAQLLAYPEGEIMLPIEKYELYYEIQRMQRKISLKPITKLLRDTLETEHYRFRIEFDYLTNVSFDTKKIAENWYIVNYSD